MTSIDVHRIGQLTEKDCWISATILAFFLGTDVIPNIRYHPGYNIVSFPDGRGIILKSPCENYKEAVLRATRVYFADNNSDLQSKMVTSDLNYFGNPDLISKLFFNRTFDTYSTSMFSFYKYISYNKCKYILDNRETKEVFLITFKFNSSHLYVFSSISGNTLTMIDISYKETRLIDLPLREIRVLMKFKI